MITKVKSVGAAVVTIVALLFPQGRFIPRKEENHPSDAVKL